MSNDYIEEIDEILSEELPDDPEEVSEGVPVEQKQKMISLLESAKEEFGRSPSLRQFNSLDFEVSGYAIQNAFGTWNDAKREAGLETYEAGEGRYATTEVNEEYFNDLDSPEKAYWLGTVVARSSIKRQDYESYLQIGRAASKEHFVRGFAEAIDSEYSVTENSATSKQEQNIIQTCVFNQRFIENLLSAGYPDPDKPESEIPTLDTGLRAPFVRGYLESSGYFSTGGWVVRVDDEESAERLQNWFGSFGAKRPTIGKNTGSVVVNVSNVFDIKSVFEECWPNGISTEPSFTPYPKKILEYLQSEYPYPENVS
ncbi:homing endonuclease associated repeat-containing protein [Halobacteriaceae archaeon SHR40]|uniref:homing endonuclease associated repeat-containing protein n=1 Tax=Halovenus amylolytica TaxID=2500550 RepID=UPI000FE3200C